LVVDCLIVGEEQLDVWLQLDRGVRPELRQMVNIKGDVVLLDYWIQ
jgi:hypothetical protein